MKTQQFELWTQCNNNCSYCYLGKRRFAGTPEQKIQNMNFALDWMRQYEHYDEYNNVSFIGGEFFQGQLDTPEVKAKWIELMEQMQDLFENDLITASWISATLTIGDQQDLFDTLKMFEGICTHQKQLWIVTSYDTIGRFHSKENLENWNHNMKEIKKRFPWVYLNTCMIITDDFCKKIISGELDLRAFREEYQTHLFIKPPYPIDDGSIDDNNANIFSQDERLAKAKQEMNRRIPDFYPTKANFIAACEYLKKNQPEILEKMIEQRYRANNLYHVDKDSGKMENAYRSRDNSKQEGLAINTCGHSIAYRSYADCNDCIVCDKQRIERGE